MIRDLSIHSVEDAVQLLTAASSILHDDCIHACLLYLSCVHWESRHSALIKAVQVPHPKDATSSQPPQADACPRHPRDDIAVRLGRSKWSLQISDCQSVFHQPTFNDVLLLCEKGSIATKSQRSQARIRHNLAISACCARLLASSTMEASSYGLRYQSIASLKSLILKICDAVAVKEGYHSPILVTPRRRGGAHIDYKGEFQIFSSSKRIVEMCQVRGTTDRWYSKAMKTLEAGLKILRAFMSGEVLLCGRDRLLLAMLWLLVATRVLQPSTFWRDYLRRSKKTLDESICAIVVSLHVKDQREVFRFWKALCPLAISASPPVFGGVQISGHARHAGTAVYSSEGGVFSIDLTSAFVAWCRRNAD
ncbi:hypothetical protein KP509_20G049500 [Ceratopteris richardii]|uniref:Uncharacterized protein n=1 Tax=Ceratopteris richardii TaxID=49495 RepID=A0A8T2SIA9_CERRI|nr:hypothetical protein KP509_20G049500 [Ceratopteris richardii]